MCGKDARPEGTEPPGRSVRAGLRGIPPSSEGLAPAPAVPSLDGDLPGRPPPSRSRSLRQRGSGARLTPPRGNFPSPPPAPGRGWARPSTHGGAGTVRGVAVGDGPPTWRRGLRGGRSRLPPGVGQSPGAELRRCLVAFSSWSAVRGGEAIRGRCVSS